MKALLLAGGYGTRLRPLTNTTPKCLVEINGKPLLEYWLDIAFGQLDCSEVIINTHYLAACVESFIKDSPYQKQTALAYEPELLGTLNTIRDNADLLSDDEMLIAHADNFCVADWQAFKAAFRRRDSGMHMTMMTFDTDSPKSCGMVNTDGQGRIIEFEEKPLRDWCGTKANGAVFLLDKVALAGMKNGRRSDSDLCKDFLPDFINHINCFHNQNIHIDIGTPEKLELANAMEERYD